MTCTQKWEFLLFYPWQQRHSGDVKLKRGKQHKMQKSPWKNHQWHWHKINSTFNHKFFSAGHVLFTVSKQSRNCFWFESKMASSFRKRLHYHNTVTDLRLLIDTVIKKFYGFSLPPAMQHNFFYYNSFVDTKQNFFSHKLFLKYCCYYYY